MSTTVSEDSIRVEHLGVITRITMCREARRNALDRAAQERLSAALDAFADDPSQRVAILTGAGSVAFSAGHDLKTAAPIGVDGLLPGGFGGLTARFDLDKPLIAAINGLAYGGGFELALACDIVVAAEHARFALPEARVGMAALGGGILRLSRTLPRQQAMAIILTGLPVTATQGHAMGFVTEVVPADELERAAMRWAEAIVEASPLAVAATKRVALDCIDEPLPQANRRLWNLPMVEQLQVCDDAREGPLAFAEKRKPRWSVRG